MAIINLLTKVMLDLSYGLITIKFKESVALGSTKALYRLALNCIKA